MSDSQRFALIIILVSLLAATWWFLIRVPPPQPRPEEWWAAREAEREREKRTGEFIELFGFDPKLLPQHRYTKEVLLRLGFFAKELNSIAERTAEFPHIWREYYDALSKRYMDALEVIGYFDPELQRDIPHWSEFMKFVNDWLAGKRTRTPRNTVVAEN